MFYKAQTAPLETKDKKCRFLLQIIFYFFFSPAAMISTMTYDCGIIQKLDFSSSDEEGDGKDNVQASPGIENPSNAMAWRTGDNMFPVTPQRNERGVSPSGAYLDGSPGSDGSPLAKIDSDGECPGTPLHYHTWNKLKLCDTPFTPKVKLTSYGGLCIKMF